jgi:predicted O-methyltransferase YrrM
MQSTLDQIYRTLYYQSIVNPSDHDFQNSDKGTVHSYTDYYESLFSSLRDKPIRLLEIGVQGGISLLLWKEYFLKGDITGIDIDYSRVQRKVIEATSHDNPIRLIQSDATLPNVTNHLLGKYDIIIDDGSHSFSHQIASFLILKDFLNTDGLYIIEDVQTELEAQYLNKLIPSSEIVDLRKIKNRYDDLLVVYKNSK